jgi:molecular chaperone GrpE
MGGASKDLHDDADVAAASEAAAPSEAVQSAPADCTALRAEELNGAPGEPDGTDHPHPVELDLEELVARAQKADEYLDLAQRTKADFENFRKRTARDAAAAQTRGMSKLALELLPAIDNLERALSVADITAAEELTSGVKLVYDELLAGLGRAGIEPFSPKGEPFDPQQHEAVAQLPAPETEPGTIIEVYQRGYRLGDAVLRPARVSVAG